MATIGFKANDKRLNDDLDNFNFDDFNFDAPKQKDDRHPVMKALKPVGRGAKDYITSSSNIEKFVKGAFPKGYGQAYDMAGEVKGDLKELYNTAAAELKPIKDTAKSMMRKALPSLDGKIPKGLQEKLKKFSAAEEQWQSSQGDGREEQLGALLTSIFQEKAQDQVRQRTEVNEREKIKQGFEQIRHRDQISQLDAIRLAAEAQVQFQNKVSFNVQKKQLELSYRMFWAMADLNKEQKKSNATMISALESTVKNTGLPDFAKITAKEQMHQIMRNKFLEGAQEKLFGGTRQFFSKFANNLGQKALGHIRELSGAASLAGGMADGMGDMPGMSVGDELLSALVQFPMDWLAGKGSKKANQLLSKDSRVRRGGAGAAYYGQTAGERVREKLTAGDWKKFDSLRKMLVDALPDNRIAVGMQTDSLAKAHEPMPFSRAASKSITEIIPGLLSRIHREIKILRTGDESTPLTSYDFAKNTFSTDKQIAADLKAKLSVSRAIKRDKDGKPLKDKDGVVQYREQGVDTFANDILSKVDRGGKLTPAQRERARKLLIQKSVMGDSLDISNIHSGQHWGGGTDGDAIGAAFNRYLRASNGKLGHNERSYGRQMDLLQSQAGFANGLGDPRAQIQQLINAGQLETLQQMGIVNEKNQFNREEYARWMTGGDVAWSGGAQPPNAPGAMGSAPSTSASPAQMQRERNRRSRGRGSNKPIKVKTNLKQKININLSGLQGLQASAYRDDGGVQSALQSISEALNNQQGGGTVEKNVQSIADILSGLDDKYTIAADAQYSVLTMMLQRLSEMASKDPNAARAAGDAAAIMGGGRQRAYTSLWEHLKGSGKDNLRKAKVYGAMIKRKGMRLWDKYSPGVKDKAQQAGAYVGGKVKDFAGKLSSLYGDVVVSGESFPRLRAALLQAGEYRDKATGRVLTSLEDITGDVVDAAGNPVITLQEFYNAYVTGSVNKRVKDLFSKLKSKLEDWKDQLQDAIPATVRNLKAKALKVFDTVKKMLPPYDVYVKTDMKRPLLYANMMRYEMYSSQKTGKKIKHPRDIDGPVIDEIGNVVLSEEHIKQGLVDVAGDPVGNGLARMAIKAIRKGAQAWEMMRDAAIGIFGSIGKGLGNVGQYFKNFFAPFADMITNSRKTVTLLQAIHDMLDARLPGKKVKGDADGDGIRDGSLEDIHRKHHGDDSSDDGHHEHGPKEKGGGIAAGLIAGIQKLMGKKKDDGDDDHDGGMLDDAADAADIYDSVRGDRGSRERRRAAKKRLARMKGKKPGFFGRMGRGIGKVAKRIPGVGRLGGLFKGVGTAGGVAAGVGSAALKSGAGVAGRTGKFLAGDSKLAKLLRWGTFNTDIVGGAGKAVGKLGKAMPYAGRLLGAAGAAYSGYSAYNNFKEGNYGSAALDAGMGAAGLAMTGGGLAGLGTLGGGILTGLGLVLSSPFLVPALAVAGAGALGYMAYKSMQKTRVTNLSKIRLAQYGIKDDDTDGVNKIFALEEMLDPLATLKDDGNMYLDEKKLDTKEVASMFDITREEDMNLFNMWYKRRFVPVFRRWLTEVRKIDKNGKVAKVETVIPGKDKLRVATAVVGALSDSYGQTVGWNSSRPRLAFRSVEDVMQVVESVRAALEKEREGDGGEKATAGNKTEVASGTKEASALAQKALTDKASYNVTDKDGKAVDVTGMEVGALTEKIKKGELSVNVAVALPANLLQSDSSTLDALTSIRFKAYGLTSMSADKCRMLGALELFMGDYLTTDTDNPKLSISTERVLQVAGQVFGVPNPTGEHAVRWKTWFNGRFLPVFLLWAGTVRKKTGKAKLKDANATYPLTEQTALARAIIGAQGISGSGARVSIWQILSNPWSDAYELNSNADTTASNLEAIRQLSDKVTLGEVTGKVVKPGDKKDKEDLSKPYIGFPNMGLRRGARTGVGMQATGDHMVGADKDAKPLPGMGDSLRFGGGGSGNYSDLPTPQGAGWQANKELILKAAAMAGVDPKALIATIAVESSFDPNAAPSNPNLPSSAKGLGQHLDSSWTEDLNAYGKNFGIPNGTNQFDARASALMTAARLRHNGEQLQKNLGRAVTVTDLYLAHLMGLAGATKFLKSPEDAIGAEVAAAAAKQHPDYFYEGGRALTVKQVYAKFAQKLAKRPAEFGVTDTDMSSKASSSGTGTAPAAPGAAPGAASAQPQGNAQAAPAAPGTQPQRPGAASVPSAGSTALNTPIKMEQGKGAVMGDGPKMTAGPGVKHELRLTREDSEDDGTYGTLRFPDGTVLNSLELPWRNNEAQTSCIPPGQYECKKRASQHFGAAYEVQGVPGRTGVLIHAGNAAGDATKGMKADSKGCILLGMDRGRKGNQKVITASKAAMQLFYEKMQDQPFTLIVVGSKNNTATGDKAVNFDPVRQPTVNASVAPKQEIAPQAQTPDASTPQGPRVSATAGPQTATSSDLPRLNTTAVGFKPGGPSSSDMQQRDAALSAVIAPKIDSMASSLLESLTVQKDGVSVLRQILDAIQNGPEPQKPPTMSSGKAKPETSTTVPVPQRRSF